MRRDPEVEALRERVAGLEKALQTMERQRDRYRHAHAGLEKALQRLRERLLEAEKIDQRHGLTLPGDSALYVVLGSVQEDLAIRGETPE